jgi:hypothetical protein
MATNTQPTEALPNKDVAYARLAKSVLRRRAVDQLVNAIKRDLTTLPKVSAMAKRSVKVLDYMRGYIAAVEVEHEEALVDYEAAVVYDFQEKDKLTRRNKSSLGRHRANSTD